MEGVIQFDELVMVAAAASEPLLRHQGLDPGDVGEASEFRRAPHDGGLDMLADEARITHLVRGNPHHEGVRAAALTLPGTVWTYAILLASVCTVLPVFLVAESLKRIGANHFALIGALGPVTTVLADFALLEGALTPLQIAGGALVIGGVLLVTLKKG